MQGKANMFRALWAISEKIFQIWLNFLGESLENALDL